MILVVVVVVLVGVMSYFIFTSQPKQITTQTNQPQPNNPNSQQQFVGDTTEQQNKIANWQTYNNTKYHYQIKYPTNWAVEVDNIVVWQNQVPNPELGNSIMFFGTKTEPYGQTARTLWNIRVLVSPAENPEKLSPRDWFIEQSKLDFPYGVEQEFDNLEDTTFKGLRALKIKGRPGEGYSFLIAKDFWVYNLTFSFEKFNGGEFDVPPEQIFQQMLDSFILN